MKKTLTLAGLALAVATLGGCGGGGDSSAAPSTSAPVSSPAPGSSDPASSDPASSDPASSAAETPSPSTAPAKVVDPCQVLDAGTIADLTGVKVKKGTTQDVGGSKVCSWLPKNGGTSNAAVFSAQEGPLPGPLSQVEDQLKSQFDGKVTKLSVPGADDARYITGKKSGLNVIDVLAQKDGVFYQVLVASPRDVGQHKSAAIKVAEALLDA